MIVTHCATLHHPHYPPHTTLTKTSHTPTSQKYPLDLRARTELRKIVYLTRKNETDRKSSFSWSNEVLLCIEQTIPTDQTNAYATQLFPNANPMERDQQTFGIPKTKHDFTHCFANHHISHRQTHHTTTPANELLTTGYEGGLERTPHSSAPPLPLSNLKKPDSPQDEPREFLTFQ